MRATKSQNNISLLPPPANCSEDSDSSDSYDSIDRSEKKNVLSKKFRD